MACHDLPIPDLAFRNLALALLRRRPRPSAARSHGPAVQSARRSACRYGAIPLTLALGSAAWIGAQPAQAAPAPAPATSAVVQEILDGKELYIDQQQARVKQRAAAPQAISTRNSRGQLQFQNGAVGRINRLSRLQLGAACFQLDRGQILVSGPQAGCTRSARMSVRGTNYVLEVDEQGAAELSVLEGTVEVTPLQDGEPDPQASPVTVAAGQRLQLSPEGVVITLLQLAAGDYTSILNGPLFEGFRLPLPAMGALDTYIRANVPGVRIPSVPGGSRLPGGYPLPGFIPRLF
ncbi:FecR domain-containing protein [Cyanobium sp. CH-040]|nr:FecR domain-containing protein [Cyanobium sp. CH-040]